MNYEINPPQFNPKIEVVGCIVEAEEEIILLKREKSRSYGEKWGIPSGKIEKSESPSVAIKREIMEETGLDVEESSLSFIKSYKVRHFPKKDFQYYLFALKSKKKFTIKLSSEHIDSIWISPKEALSLDLVPGTELQIKDITSYSISY